jgi:hypothetical protein
MNTEAFKLARATLKLAVREYGWTRNRHDDWQRCPYGQKRYSYGLGKFEGEHWSIVHFWDAYMNGCSEASGDTWDAMEVVGAEREAFGLHPATFAVVLWHSEQGFVSMQEVTETQYSELTDECGELDSAEEYEA